MDAQPTFSAVEAACREITAHVARGRWPGGYPLIEADLTSQLNASRSTVREALRALEAQGLLVKGRSRNLVVRRLSRRDVSELYELREVLESYAAGRAATQFDGLDAPGRREWARTLRWWQDAVRSRHRPEAMGDANRTLHMAVQALSGNAHLPRLLEGTLMTLFVSQFRNWLGADSITRAASEHVDLIEAIMAGKEAAASRAMRMHVRSSARTILALGPDLFGPDQA